MKTFLGVMLNIVAFVAIWFVSAFISLALAFRGWDGSVIGEYLRLGFTWFICPGIGSYFALKVTRGFIQGLNIDAVTSSFITLLSVVFIALMAFSIISYSGRNGSSISEMVQLTLQFVAIIGGALLGKIHIKSEA
ncbi:hypothetical protein [Vibrio fluvialis]|uniref:hypothetical protein n=1 Tax=Vibrio fluvialis TaxID=676 RepID=UPI0028DD9AED|nr:hypothetical protein [Vibrio fluvialis]MDT8868279.1 hypothetical protein [Vibrio fluvialis]MDT8875718.1 hypothetical protein [Vibrio fluvialis]